jgi:hypothetical protein
MGDAKIGGKWQLHPSIPLLSQRNAAPLDTHLYVHSKMPRIHYLRVAPPWATEKPAPHFGKPSGLAAGSRKQSKMM